MNRYKYKIVIHKSGSTDSHAYRTSAKGAIKFAFDQQQEAKTMADRFSCYSGVCTADIYRKSDFLFGLNFKPRWVLAAKVSSSGGVHFEDAVMSEDGIKIAYQIAELEKQLDSLRKCEKKLVEAVDSILEERKCKGGKQ